MFMFSRCTMLYCLLVLIIVALTGCSEIENKALLIQVIELDGKSDPHSDNTGWVGKWTMDPDATMGGQTLCDYLIEGNEEYALVFDSISIGTSWTFKDDKTWTFAIEIEWLSDDRVTSVGGAVEVTGTYSLDNSNFTMIPDTYDFFEEDNIGTWEITGNILTLSGDDGTVTVLEKLDAKQEPQPIVCPLEPEPDTTPPVIISGTVVDGDAFVAPANINAEGIHIEFSKAINYLASSISIETEDGTVLDWFPVWGIRSVRFYPDRGGELEFENTYVMKLSIQDKVGNNNDVVITFTTAALE